MRIAVVGAGVVGLATAYELLQGGHDVVCIDSCLPMGERSAGDTRIFRLAHARPELVEHAIEARRLWRSWSSAAKRELVGAQQLVISGVGAEPWAAAMRDAGVGIDLLDTLPDALWLPGSPKAPFVVDEAAGVIDVQATGEFLLGTVRHAIMAARVHEIEPGASGVRIHTDSGDTFHDHVVVAAGRGTSALAAQVAIDVPGTLVRHTRYTFGLREPRVTACWIETVGADNEGYRTYGLSGVVGRCSIGGALPAEDVAWELGADEVARLSLQAMVAYVGATMPGVDPTPISRIDCDFTPLPGGDGFEAVTRGPVTVFWGDNLFMYAPLLGRELGSIAVGGRAATSFSLL